MQQTIIQNFSVGVLAYLSYIHSNISYVRLKAFVKLGFVIYF